MKQLSKALLLIVLVLLLVPFFIAGTYDAFVFQPHRNDIAQLLVEADTQDRNPPDIIHRLIYASHLGGSPTTPVARGLLVRFLPEAKQHGGMLGWHFRFALWDVLVRLHLSHEEVIGLYSTLVYNGQGHGINALALRMYGKPLSQLSEEEAATVVAVSWAPMVYLKSPARLNKRRDLLLSRIRNVTQQSHAPDAKTAASLRFCPR
jgi:hypothetical protein